MQYKEIEQRLRYKKDELCQRLNSIKEDFATKEDLDDVLFTIAHDTKVELAKIKETLEALANEQFGKCTECGKEISIESLTKNPFQELCDSCKKKA